MKINLVLKTSIVLFISLLIVCDLKAQEINWTEQSNNQLPDGVQLFKGTRNSPKLQAFYLIVDLDEAAISVRPYTSTINHTVPQFVTSTGAFAAVNGGFFGGSTSYSSVVYPGEVKAINVKALTRNSESYPVIRSMFSTDTSGACAVDWIYHFDNTPEGIYQFAQPMDYSYNDPTPKPAPQKTDGQPLGSIISGIGGAPVLVKNGQINITYDQEVMWGSGVGFDNRDPRTAVGYTNDKKVILFVADGRQSISEGVGLPELAQIMLDLGCHEAMNLDGGGSTQMAVSGQYINSPSEQRPVPTIFAIVDRDSLGLPDTTKYEKIIDSGDSECSFIGDGWFPTANQGFWGETPSMLHSKGDGSAYARYKLNLPEAAEYEIYAWWVASGNRTTDTPFVVNHATGIDTVRLDQTQNGSSWVLVGSYFFASDTSGSLSVSDAATSGTYVVVDAIKITSDEVGGTAILTNSKVNLPDEIRLYQNYPNPFNPSTRINFILDNNTEYTELSIYSLLGQKVRTLLSQSLQSGSHTATWNGKDSHGIPVGTGIYMYRLKTDHQIETKKMLLIR